MHLSPASEDSYDVYKLTRELDKTKTAVFLGKNAAFLGSLMCAVNFVWSRDIPTAGTDMVTFWWNPDWFISMDPEARKTVLLHELWHVARLHGIRGEGKMHRIWNYACDIRINNDLENEAYSFFGIENCWKDKEYDKLGIAAEEDIYDKLLSGAIEPPSGSWGESGDDGDMIPIGPGQKQTAINNVVQAVHQAKLAGQAGQLPGDIELVLNKFLEPVIPWQTVLMQFFTDLLDEDYSWKRPNRRYQDMYLPSRFTDDGRLAHLIYYLDVSGSITDHDILRFNSEVKYIQEVLKPLRLTLVQFDDGIRAVKEFEIDQPFDEIKVTGRGGTMWAPVKEHIEKNEATAVIVFTDMGFWDPITKLEDDTPIIWVIQNNRGTNGPYGKSIHIK